MTTLGRHWVRFVVSFVLFAISAFTDAPLANATTPSWLPAKSCRDSWGGRDLGRFDPSLDTRPTKRGNEGYGDYRTRLAQKNVVRSECRKDWTVLVYMAGDNDLSPYALWDIDEMEGRFESGRLAGSTLKSDLVVQLDTADTSGLRRLHIFQREDQSYTPAKSKSEFVDRSPSDIQSPIVEWIDELAAPTRTASPKQRLQEFLEWGVKNYPADNYMVIVWGHGQGWSAGPLEPPAPTDGSPAQKLKDIVDELSALPAPPPSRFGGIMINSATGKSLSVLDLKDVLESVVTETLEGRPIDVYASDACLMQMAEVAFEVAPFTRFISGSAQVQTFLGLPYRRLMYEINSGRFLSVGSSVGKSDEALLIAKMLPLLTEASLDPVHGHHGRAEPAARKTFTMSSLSSLALQHSLIPALSKFSEAMQNYLREDVFRRTDISFAMKYAPSFMGGGKELGSFLSLIEIARNENSKKSGRDTAASAQLRLAIETSQNALDQTVIERRMGTDYQSSGQPFYLLGHRGVGVWIPNGPIEFKERAQDFAASAFSRETDWPSWLRPAMGLP